MLNAQTAMYLLLYWQSESMLLNVSGPISSCKYFKTSTNLKNNFFKDRSFFFSESVEDKELFNQISSASLNSLEEKWNKDGLGEL